MAKTKGKPPKGYDSWFEYELHLGVLSACSFHKHKIQYVQHKVYEPDFTVETDKGIIYIEVKGRFRDSAEARKYVDIRESLKDTEELVFLFYDPNTPMPRARRRSDGTKFTMSEWADKNAFRFFDAVSIEALLEGKA
jgi:hypothetical protein